MPIRRGSGFTYREGSKTKKNDTLFMTELWNMIDSVLSKEFHSSPPAPTGEGVSNVRWGPLEVYVNYFQPPAPGKYYYNQHIANLKSMMERDGFSFQPNLITMGAGYSDPMAPVLESEVWITRDQVIEPEA